MLQTLQLCVSAVLTPTICKDKIELSNARIEIVQPMSNIIQCLFSNEEKINDDGYDCCKQHITKITWIILSSVLKDHFFMFPYVRLGKTLSRT